MCDEDFFDCLTRLKSISDQFLTSKMTKNLATDLKADDDVLYFNNDSANAVFSCNGMFIINVDPNNINLNDNNHNEDDPETIIRIRLLSQHIKFEKRKTQN